MAATARITDTAPVAVPQIIAHEVQPASGGVKKMEA